MPTTKSALVFLSCVALLTPPLAAQQADDLPLTVQGEQLLLEALEQQLVLPLPDWLEADTAISSEFADLVSAHFHDGSGQASLEIYPLGESEAFWTRLYGARIVSPSTTTLADLREVIIDVYARACRPETVALFQLEPDNGDVIPPLGFVCGAYQNLPGYAGKGEVMVMGFHRSATGVAMVYQEWRGAAFDPEDATSWPVSSAEIETRVTQFKSAVALTSVD